MKNFNSKKKIRISYTKRNNDWKNSFYPGQIPIYSKESLLGLKRTQSESLYRFNSFNNSNSNLPILQQSEIDNEDSELYLLWDDLGVESHYRRVFEYHLKTLSSEEKKEFVEYEKTSLNRIKENLCKLSKAIAERDKSIEGLKKIDKVVSTYNNAKLDDLLIADIIQSIKAIRFHSINVVNFMTKVREILSYHQMKGKIDINKINKKYCYDNNYLIKMKFDIDFFKQSAIKKYFLINKDIELDTFLLNISSNKNDMNKLTVPITVELIKAIHQAKFIISQDTLLYQAKCEKNTMSNINATSHLPTQRFRSRAVSNYSMRSFGSPKSSTMSLTLHRLKATPGYNNLFLNSKSTNKMTLKKTSSPEKKVVSKEELMSKIKEYEDKSKEEIKPVLKKEERKEEVDDSKEQEESHIGVKIVLESEERDVLVRTKIGGDL